MPDSIEIENRARLSRTTCGWPKPEHDRAAVRRYWRDLHSPAISRRAGIYWYRHSPYDPVREDLFAAIDDIARGCPVAEQIQWQSDVVYRDEAGLAEFMRSPADPEVTALLLGDIELLVDKSTTYRAVDDNLHTYVDRTGDPTPQGPPAHPRYGVYFRARSAEPAFRDCLRSLARRWSETPGVLRVRLNLFDVPDMEAERAAGYPVKTHPLELQYQAWIDLVIDDDAIAGPLLRDVADLELATHLAAVHAYPVPAYYTFVWDGAPTIPGLRGYPAYQVLEAFGAENQRDPRMLEWMYGAVAHGAGAPLEAIR
jgi:hypothetical protein